MGIFEKDTSQEVEDILNPEERDDLEDAFTEEQIDFSQKDIEKLEQLQNEETGVYATIEPPIPSGNFLVSIWEDFLHKDIKFIKKKTKREILSIRENQEYEKIHTMTLWLTHNDSFYVLPLLKQYEVVDYNKEEIDIYKDKEGIYYIKTKKQDIKIADIKIAKKTVFFADEKPSQLDILNSSKPIYTWKFDISMFKDPYELRSFISKENEYNVSNQKKIRDKSRDANDYIDNIISEKTWIECMTANILLVALSRSMWYPARLVSWVKSYTKDKKTKLNKNRWHSWSEVYINWKWETLDATPLQPANNGSDSESDELENDEQKNDSSDSESSQNDKQKNDSSDSKWDQKGESKQDKSSDSESSQSEKDNGDNSKAEKDETEEHLNELMREVLWNPKFTQVKEIKLDSYRNLEEWEKRVLNYVMKDALNIVNYLQKVISERLENSKRRRLWQKLKRTKDWLPQWDLVINSKSISRISTGNPNIFSKNKKPKNALVWNIDTKLKDISIAIDISWSMENLQENEFDNPSKITNAYFSVLLLWIISEQLEINLNITLFSDCVIEIKEKLFLNWEINPKFFQEFKKWVKENSGWNSKNYNWVSNGLKSIERSKKWALFILSDWDGNSNQFFKSWNEDKNINYLKQNLNISVLWYWLWLDASVEASTDYGESRSVIETQLYIKWEQQRVKWFPLENYNNLVKVLKTHLSILMTSKKIRL